MTIELAHGWSGTLITHEGYFVGFDGSLTILAVVVFNFAHPGRLLPKGPIIRGRASCVIKLFCNRDGAWRQGYS
jgi:hypothetical protein